MREPFSCLFTYMAFFRTPFYPNKHINETATRFFYAYYLRCATQKITLLWTKTFIWAG